MIKNISSLPSPKMLKPAAHKQKQLSIESEMLGTKYKNRKQLLEIAL